MFFYVKNILVYLNKQVIFDLGMGNRIDDNSYNKSFRKFTNTFSTEVK